MTSKTVNVVVEKEIDNTLIWDSLKVANLHSYPVSTLTVKLPEISSVLRV